MANEKRLIDANALKKLLRTDKGADAVGHSIVRLLKVDNIIDESPTVDAVEVVRCKDCKWFGQPGCAIWIVDDSDKPKEEDFCSFGERKIMRNTREKLKSLLMQKGFGVEGATIAADHLIENGVTISDCIHDCKNCWKTQLCNPKWIPVTERLPEVRRHVLAWSTVGNFYETAFWNGARWNVTWDHDEFVGVTHWMSLPEPPMDGERKDDG